MLRSDRDDGCHEASVYSSQQLLLEQSQWIYQSFEMQRMEHLCLLWRQNSSRDEQARANPRVLKDFMQIRGFFLFCGYGDTLTDVLASRLS